MSDDLKASIAASLGARSHDPISTDCDEAEAEIKRLREALTTIAHGVWTARNSVETMVWIACQALK